MLRLLFLGDLIGLILIRAVLFLHLLWFFFFSQRFFSVDHRFYSVVHILYELSLATSESSLVGDVVDVVICFCMLAVCTTNLDEVLVSYLLESVFLFTKVGKVDVNGSTKSGSQICWARSDVAEVLIMSELSDFGNNFRGD